MKKGPEFVHLISFGDRSKKLQKLCHMKDHEATIEWKFFATSQSKNVRNKQPDPDCSDFNLTI